MGLLLAALAGVFVGPPTWAGLGALALLLLPGLLLSEALLPDDPGRLVIGLCLGYALVVLASLGLAASSLGFTRPGLIGLSGGLTILGMGLKARFAPQGVRAPRAWWLAGLAVAAIALAARLVGSARSEFMGDEAKVLLWATDLLQGRESILLLHRKGPAEILLAAAHYGLMGATTELAARLPFSLASCLGVLGLMLVANQLSGPRAGLLAGLLGAIDGFTIGFGRMVQYPNLVLCLSVGAIYCALRLVTTGQRRYGLVCGLLMAGLALCHWDFVWTALIVALLAREAWRQGREPHRPLLQALGLCFGLPLCAGLLFYIPYLTGPTFPMVREYLGYRMVGQRVGLHDNTLQIAQYAIIYNSVYYALSMGLAAGLATLASLRARRLGPRARWAFVALALALGAALFALDPGHPVRAALLWLAAACLLYALLSGPDPANLPLFWFLIPLAAYAFVIRKPLLSIYNIMPGAIVLVATAAARMLPRIRPGWPRTAAWGALGGLYLLSAGYVGLAYAAPSIEYIRTYPRFRQALYWTPFTASLPDNAGCGFPHQAGWKAIGALYADGRLQGDYASNEEELITHWYTRGAVRCSSDPRYLFLANQVKDVQTDLPSLDDYRQIGVVRTEGVSRIEIWERAPAQGEAQVYRVADARAAFDRQLSTPTLYTGRPRAHPMADEPHPLAIEIGEHLTLEGWRIEPPNPQPGDQLNVLLYGRVRSPEMPELWLSLQLTDGDETYLQRDLPIGCGYLEDEDWFPSAHLMGRYPLLLSPDLPQGWLVLRLGAYTFQWEEGVRRPQPLALCDASGRQPCAERVILGKVQVGDAPRGAPQVSADWVFGDALRLYGYDLEGPTSGVGELSVTLHWEALRTLPADYTVFVHLRDGAGAIVAQHDAPPQGGLNPTWAWLPGETVADRHVIPLPAGTPTGRYTLRVGLYELRDGGRLPVTGAAGEATSIALTEIRVER
jgi:hypothetical protein